MKQEGRDQLCVLGTRKSQRTRNEVVAEKTNYITVNYETKRKHHTRKIKLGNVRAVKLAVSSRSDKGWAVKRALRSSFNV